MQEINMVSKYTGFLLTGLTFLMVFTFWINLKAQEEKIRVSPKAEVMQVVGFTEVQINYSRPGVKGRKVWGELVPYNKVWRAGANEATTIRFSTNVEIEGKKLPAGTYSLFTIPNKDEWTLIFNKTAEQWGAFEYNESEDALRVNVKPEMGESQEWLAYTITKASDKSAVVKLEWEKLKVPFKVTVQ
jgi:hypothetical protein